MARRLLTDPAPELRSSFEELVLKVRRPRCACARVRLEGKVGCGRWRGRQAAGGAEGS